MRAGFISLPSPKNWCYNILCSVGIYFDSRIFFSSFCFLVIFVWSQSRLTYYIASCLPYSWVKIDIMPYIWLLQNIVGLQEGIQRNKIKKKTITLKRPTAGFDVFYLTTNYPTVKFDLQIAKWKYEHLLSYSLAAVIKTCYRTTKRMREKNSVPSTYTTGLSVGINCRRLILTPAAFHP